MRVNWAGYMIFFLVIAASLGINLGLHILDTLHLSPNYVLLTLIAVTMAGLLVNQKLFFLLLVTLMSIAVNLPEEYLVQWQISRDVLLTALVGIVVMPAANKLMGLERDSR